MSDIVARPYHKDYEITDAMFGAFRSPGGSGLFWKLFGWTTALYTLLFVLALPPIVRGYVSMFSGMGDIDPGDTEAFTEAAEAMTASLTAMIAPGLLLLVGSLLVLAVVRAAFYRSYFHGAKAGAFPFRLGADEWRQFLAQLGYWGLFIVFLFLFMVAVFVIGALLGLASAGAGGESAAMIVVLLITVLAYLGFFVFFAWYGVNFAPAAALTGLRRNVHVLAARKVTKNRFWALFGSLLVAGILAYVSSNIGTMLGMSVGLSGVFSGDVMSALFGDEPEVVAEAFAANASTLGFKIKAFLGILIYSAGYAFYSLILLGPSAFFTRQWDESDPVRSFG